MGQCDGNVMLHFLNEVASASPKGYIKRHHDHKARHEAPGGQLAVAGSVGLDDNVVNHHVSDKTKQQNSTEPRKRVSHNS